MHRFLPGCCAAAVLLCTAQADIIQVGTYPAKVVPEQASTVPVERGLVSDLADASGRLERGAVIAIVNKEKTAQERDELELQLSREKITKKDEIRKLEAQRKKVDFYLNTLTPEERKYATDAGTEGAPPSKEALADIDERLELLHRELKNMPERRYREFNRTHDALTVRMPYTGRLQYHITPPEDPAAEFEYIPSGSQPFATVCDDSAFYITINLSQTELTQLPPEQFSVYVNLPGGRKLRGTYHHRRVEHSGSADMLVYFFRLEQQDHDTAYTMLGSNAKAVLEYETGSAVRIENKARMLADPAAAECENWEQLVARLFPDYSILLIAERSIILCPAGSAETAGTTAPGHEPDL